MKKLLLALILLSIAGCTVSHRVTPLEKRRYEVQVTHRNLFLDGFFNRDQVLENKAQEICPHYRIISKDKTLDIWGNQVTRSWVIECEE